MSSSHRSPNVEELEQHNENQHLLFKSETNDKINTSTSSYSNGANGWSTSNVNLTANEDDHTGEVTEAHDVSLSRRRKLTLLLLCLANVCAGCSYSILAPFYPNEAKKKGISETLTGFIFSSFQIINFISSLIFGNYMVHIGPKFLFVAGIFTAGVCSVLFGFLDRTTSGTTFVALSFVSRSFEAFGVSAFVTSGQAIVIKEFPDHVATVFGISQTSIAAGLMIGPALGGVLNEAGGFGLPFYVIGGLICLTGFVTFIFLPPPQDMARKQKASMLLFLRSPLVWTALQFVLVMFCGLTFLQPIFSTYLEQFHLSPSVIGLLFVVVPVLEALSVLWGYLADKKNIRELQFICGSLLCSLGFLAIGPSPLLPFLPIQLWVIIVGLFVFGFGVGFAFVAPVKCIVQGACELGFEYNLGVMGMVAGLFGAAIYIGDFIGPSLAGLLVQCVGFRWATTVMSGLFFLSALYSSTYFSIRCIKTRQRDKALQEQHETKETYNEELRAFNVEPMQLAWK